MTREIDLSALPDSSRLNLHRRLYQTECRAGLMWLLFGLACWSYTAPIFETLDGWKSALLGLGVVVYSALLALWTIVPVQSVLAEVRADARDRKEANLERGFDSSWGSMKDFVFLAVMMLVGLAVWWLRVKAGAVET